MPIYNPSLEQTATLIVAASDSLYAERADFTCDGTADDVEINAAFALGAADTRVVLLEGTYTLADSIIFTNNNQVLEGQGRGTFLDGDGLATTEHAIIATGLTNIAVKNLAIQTADGGGGTIHCIFLDDGCNDFLIDNVVIVDSDSDGIHIAGTNVVGGIISDCIIADVDDHGIYVDVDAANTAARITVKNNRIAGAGNDGLYVGATGAGSPYWTIEGNNIVNSTQNGMELYELTYSNIVHNVVYTSTFHGIILGAGSSHNNVEGNQVYNNVRHGIGLVDCTENTLIGNTCNGNDSGNTNTYCGIHIQACNYTTVVGNHCYDNDKDGICILRCSYCVVTGNNCHENTQGDGIMITGDGTANADYNTISDNNASGNGSDGISVVGGTDANGNHITGNYVASNSVYGITVAGPDTKIEDNYLYHNGGGAAGTYHGIYLAGTSDRCSVNNNIIGDDGTDTEDGINLADGAINCQISGNYIYNLMGDGIRLMANNTSTVISDNYCLTHDENGIAITDSVDCTVSGNHCENNTHHGIYLDNVDEANVNGNYCRGNDRLNAATYDGIYVDVDSSYVNIVGNHCTENDRYGIYVLSVTCELTANHALTNTTGQISAAAGCVLAHNETGAVAEVHVPREATIVVAASNSVTASADRICSGAADDVDINAALTAAGAGGRVMLLEGTYTLADPIAFTNNNQVLEGQGRGAFIDGDGLATTEHAISATGLTNCEIKNLAIQTEDGGGKTCHCIFLDDGCNYTRIENVVIVDSDEDGIHIAGTSVTDIKIINCVIEDADDHGIYVDLDGGETSTGILITGCRITGTGDDGIYFGLTGAGHTYARITDNLIDSAGDCGIDLCETTYTTISDNICHTNTDAGILLSAGSNFNNMVGNQLYNNTGYGIQLVGGYNAVVANYTTTNTAGSLGDTGTLNRVKNNRGLWAGDEGIATFVVAASDSYRPANADQRCDGTADDVQIQQLLDALPAAGGRVVLMEGNYACAANITIPANATLEGQGNATILTFDDPDVNNPLTIGGNYVSIKNMKVVLAAGCGDVGGGGFRPNIIYANSKSYLWLANLWLVGDKTLGQDGSDLRQCGIIFITVTDSTIDSCHIEGTMRYPIHLNASSNHNTVTSCVCEDSAKTGMLINSLCEGNSITGCIFRDNGEQGFYLANTSSHNTITGNTMQGNSGEGINLYLCDNNTITGNTVADNDSGGTLKNGIRLECSDQNVITGNQVNDNGLHGIHLLMSSYNTISGNLCNNQNTGDGINVTGDGTENSDYNLITGNVCYANGDDGIAIEGAGDANKNIVLGNQLTGNSGTALVDNGTATQIGHNITA